MANKLDLVIKNGRIVDGTGNPWFKKDIGIKNGKISVVGVIPAEDEPVIDAEGLVVTPGFIDIHNHADYTILSVPGTENFITQGVTTVVVGNCGFSPAPIKRDRFSTGAAQQYQELLPKRKTRYPEMVTMREFYGVVMSQGLSLNIASLVGQGALRNSAVSFDMRPASREEMVEMKAMLRREMEEGAFGMSTGLSYPPGSYAGTEELVELASVLTDYRGFYSSHIRNQADGLVEAVEEAIRIGETNNIPVQISHFKTHKRNSDRLYEAIKTIEQARDRGVEVSCDVYPYIASSTGLATMVMPEWINEGGLEATLERFKSQETRQRVRDEMYARYRDAGGIISAWNSIRIATCETRREYEGKSLAEVVKMRGETVDPYDFIFDLLLEQGDKVVVTVTFGIDENDVKAVMSHPLVSIGSDGYADLPSSGGKPHPRLYGTYPRVLAKYVRDDKVLSLETAVKKMTSQPAAQAGIQGRGLIAEGFWADIVVFDPARIRDTATFEESQQYAEGIHCIIVNGEVVVDNGTCTGTRPGRVLQRTHR